MPCEDCDWYEEQLYLAAPYRDWDYPDPLNEAYENHWKWEHDDTE